VSNDCSDEMKIRVAGNYSRDHSREKTGRTHARTKMPVIKRVADDNMT